MLLQFPSEDLDIELGALNMMPGFRISSFCKMGKSVNTGVLNNLVFSRASINFGLEINIFVL